MNTTYTATSAQIGTRNTYEILAGTTVDYIIRHTHEEHFESCGWKVLWTYEENAASAYVADVLEELAYGLAYDLNEFGKALYPWETDETEEEPLILQTVDMLLEGKTEGIEESLFWPIEEDPDGYSEQAAILLNEVREWKR